MPTGAFQLCGIEFPCPQVQKTTRMSGRFIKVGEHAREFTPDKPQVREFIAFAKSHRTSIDPTMRLLESRFSLNARQVPRGLEAVAARFPPQVRRALLGGAYEPPKGFEDAYREAIPAMLAVLTAFHDAEYRSCRERMPYRVTCRTMSSSFTRAREFHRLTFCAWRHSRRPRSWASIVSLASLPRESMQTWWKISPLHQGAGAAASNPLRNNGTITRAVAKSWLLDPIGLFAQPVT